MKKFIAPLIIVLLVVTAFGLDFWFSNQEEKPTVLDEALSTCADYLQDNLSNYSSRSDDYSLNDDLTNCVNEYIFNH